MCTDLEETKEAQEKRTEYFKKKGNQQFTEDGHNAKLSENKINGPEDAIVNEMIKRLPMEKIYTITKCFQERFMGMMESPSSRTVVKPCVLEEAGCRPD